MQKIRKIIQRRYHNLEPLHPVKPLLKSWTLLVLLCILFANCFLVLVISYSSWNVTEQLDGVYVGSRANVRHGGELDHIVVDGARNLTPIAFPAPMEHLWRQHPHLVVVGILATDKQQRRDMRDNQRATWFTFPNVATKDNDFTGYLLPLYVCSLRALVPPYVSEEMVSEMQTWGDTLLLRIYENPPTKVRTPGVGGGYGMEFHMANSRKMFLWMRYAYVTFPNVPFLGKGDDDVFVFVPELLKAVQQLPRMSVMYGKVKTLSKHVFPHGLLYLLSRDIVYEYLVDDLLNFLVCNPIRKERYPHYKSVVLEAEDQAIGVVLRRLYDRKVQYRELPDGWERADYNAPADLPPLTGWGKLYSEYIRPNSTVPRTGTVSDPGDGTPTATYSFPEHPDPRNFVFVSDACRMRNAPRMKKRRQLLLAHQIVNRSVYEDYFNYYRMVGNAFVQYPVAFNVVPSRTSYGYAVNLVRNDSCWLSSSVLSTSYPHSTSLK